jgi:hypothetical protein
MQLPPTIMHFDALDIYERLEGENSTANATRSACDAEVEEAACRWSVRVRGVEGAGSVRLTRVGVGWGCRQLASGKGKAAKWTEM